MQHFTWKKTRIKSNYVQTLSANVFFPSAAPSVNSFFFFFPIHIECKRNCMFWARICMVGCEGCQNWLGASGLWLFPRCPQPILQGGKRKWGKSPWTNFQAHYPHTPRQPTLGLWTCLLTMRPALSTWRKFFRIKTHKFVFILKSGWRNMLRKSTYQRQITAKSRALLLV